MADRYWIGGTGNWSNTAHWDAHSGGAGGDTVPTSSDNVFVDSASGLSGGTLTIDYGVNYSMCHNFASNTAFSYTINVSSFQLLIYGSAIFESGLTISGAQSIQFYTSSSDTITPNSAVIDCQFLIRGTGDLTLLGDLIFTIANGGFYQDNGTFNAGIYNIKTPWAGFVYNSYVVNMGSGIWELTGTGTIWSIYGGIINPQNSTIKFSNTSSSSKTFAGGGGTYHNILFTGTGTGQFRITGSNTFNDFKVDTPPHSIRFASGTTQTVNTFTVNGLVGKLMTITASSSGSPAYLSCPSGIISCDYLSLKDSHASGGARWYAGTNSTDVSGNSGWIFETPLTSVETSASIDENDKPTLLAYNETTEEVGPILVDPVLGCVEVYGVPYVAGTYTSTTNAKIDENENSTLLAYNDDAGLIENLRCGTNGELLITRV